jgi:hypothetical protein
MAAPRTPKPKPEPEAPLTPTPADEWPKALPGLILELPSGAVARVSAPPSMYLTATGRIPPRLRQALNGLSSEQMGHLTDVLEPEMLELLMDWMVAESFLEPKVSLLPREGYLCVADIDVRDRDYIARSLELKP